MSIGTQGFNPALSGTEQVLPDCPARAGDARIQVRLILRTSAARLCSSRLRSAMERAKLSPAHAAILQTLRTGISMKQLLGSTDSLQLFPLSYPWAWEMYLENMDNHWTPREISVANDVSLWRSDRLSEAERHLFLSVMAQLTTFDVQRGDETAESLLGIIDPPEIKHYLKRLADEEALHTWAYQFIIENMGLDPQDIYSRYARVPQMKARVDLANELSTRAKRAWAKRVFMPEAALTLREKQEILFATIFWFLCFEGIWFVMGLSGPIQNLARHGKFTGAAEQF
jgi:ribonucleoside-diphosphate reductase beta chain